MSETVSHQPPVYKTPADRIAKEICDKYLRALKADLPFFVIVYYNHEADKLALIRTLRERLRSQNLVARTFDPVHQADHGVGKLYTLLAAASQEKSLGLISGLPTDADTIQADNDFISYLNLHRDQIPRESIRMVLFLQTAYAEQFIFAAGDLWDFRHGSYWLERDAMAFGDGWWEELDHDAERLNLTDREKEEIDKHLRKVRPLIEKTQEPRAKARLLADLASWLRRRHAALPAAQVAYEGLGLIDDERTQLRAVLEFELGWALYLQPEFSEALHHYEISLAISREIGGKAFEGATLNNISMIFKAHGDDDTALKYLKQALVICQGIGDKHGQGATLNNISQIYRASGDTDNALKHLKQSLAISQEIGDKAGQGATLNNISWIFKARGDDDTALKYLKQSLAISQEIGDKSGQGTALNNIAAVYHRRGDYDTALKYLKQSLTIRQEIGDKSGQAVTCYNLSKEWERREDNDQALKYITRAAAIFETIGSPDLEKAKQSLERLKQMLIR